jgi:hypothetical protein
MKSMEVMDDSSESGKKNQRPSRILSSLRRNVNVFRSATTGGGANQVLEHETRPLTTSMSGGAHVIGGIGIGAHTHTTGNSSSDKHPHGHALPTHTKSNFEIYSVRDRRDATAKRAFKVQVPKRMLYYTILVFLVLPLALFLWKEMHLDNHGVPATHDLVKSNMRGRGHDVYPTWMEQAVDTVWNDHDHHDTPANEIVGTITNDTKTADQPHHNDIGESVGTLDKVNTDNENDIDNHSNRTSGLPGDMVGTHTDAPSDSSSVLGSVSSTAIIFVTGIESDPATEPTGDSVESTTEPVSTGASDGGDGDHDIALGDVDTDPGTGTGTKLSSESAGDLLGASLDSLRTETLDVISIPSKDDDDMHLR